MVEKLMPKNRGRKISRYPWKVWFKKKILKLLRGKDYECMDHGMHSNVVQAAKRHGVKVSLSVGDGSVTVRVLSNA
jgi:hypothetical protein